MLTIKDKDGKKILSIDDDGDELTIDGKKKPEEEKEDLEDNDAKK